MGRFDIIAMASSAGGLSALGILLADLPASMPVPIVIVQHLAPDHESVLSEILNRRTRLMVKQAQNGEKPEKSIVYIAPPNRHLLINTDGTLLLDQSEPIHFVKPAADVLFASAANFYAERCIGVILTGSGRDGADGARAIKLAGGIVIAQDEETSQCFSMPEAAIKSGAVDYVLPLIAIAEKLTALVTEEKKDAD